jgi:hypothetical protein
MELHLALAAAECLPNSSDDFRREHKRHYFFGVGVFAKQDEEVEMFIS